MSGDLYVEPDAGVIAVLVRNGLERVVHLAGTPLAALHEVAALCDREGWRVRVLSSPVTVYRDLKGSRGHVKRGTTYGRDKWAGVFYAPPPENEVAVPERAMLGKIGRMDLFDAA
jgi:hypothetical protein